MLDPIYYMDFISSLTLNGKDRTDRQTMIKTQQGGQSLPNRRQGSVWGKGSGWCRSMCVCILFGSHALY